MINDSERREIAARLRELADANEGYLVMERVNRVLRDGQAILGTSGLASVADVLRRHADLIDRPTCQMVECTIDNGSRSWGMRCTACGKEFEHMKPSYGWHYCPNCGKEESE